MRFQILLLNMHGLPVMSKTSEPYSACFDVVTFGETMLRLTPPGRVRLEQANQFQLHIGGSESNTAVGLARLGLKTAWISRLPATALGRIVAGELSRYGVDTSQVVWTSDDRMGLYFLEEGGPPRGSQVLYDRRDSAISRMTPEEFPAHALDKNKTRLFHTTGITLAIGDACSRTAMHAMKLAKDHGAMVSFDVNFRSKLWSAESAARGCRNAFELADLIFIPDRDAKTLFNVPAVTEPGNALQQLSTMAPNAIWVMTRGRIGSMAFSKGQFYEQGIFASDETGRLGGGDAFSAGFLAAYLETADVAHALRWAAAVSALKYSIPGDLPLIHRSEVEALLKSGSGESLQR